MTGYVVAMSNHDDEAPGDIPDEQLPEDLQPTDDNPLAKPLSDEDGARPAEELDMRGGKTPEESGDEHPEDQSDDNGNEADSEG
jgi:hypothetical protein